MWWEGRLKRLIGFWRWVGGFWWGVWFWGCGILRSLKRGGLWVRGWGIGGWESVLIGWICMLVVGFLLRWIICCCWCWGGVRGSRGLVERRWMFGVCDVWFEGFLEIRDSKIECGRDSDWMKWFFVLFVFKVWIF